MGILQNFERRLQGAVGNTFARLFGGTVHPSEVIAAIQNEANARLEHQGGRLVAPNHFRVRLGPTDRSGIGEDDRRVAAALADTIREYVTEQGWDTFGDIEVDFEESGSLHTGQFRISSLVDPDSGRGPNRNSPRGRASAIPSTSGASPMPSDPYPQAGYQQYPASQPNPGAAPGLTQNYSSYPQANQPPTYQQPAYQPPSQYSDYSPREGYRGKSIAVLHADDGSGRSFELRHGSNIVGRGQDADFRLPDTSVSRRHIDIYFDGAIAVMHDLGSTNGSTVNGGPVQTWQLADGDLIRIGHSTIIFRQHG